ncbi:MAG TPA: hypothetical protein VFP58_05225, partial [Candidatus Eisenbacteria bacterium]|nr:hypothetical protein [Candidatus Eisenbacteria bacterium]
MSARAIRIMVRLTIVALSLALGARRAPAAEPAPARPDLSIDASTRAQVIEGVAREVESRYVFPEV